MKMAKQFIQCMYVCMCVCFLCSDAALAEVVDVTSGRKEVTSQETLGSTDVVVNVANGGQLWLKNAGSITATVNIAGMGYASNVDGQGAIRLENTVKLAGQVNLLEDACIGTYYNAETGKAKDIQAAVDLNDYTLWLGASDNITDETVTSSPYWFTDMTVSGKITGNGGLVIRNTRTIFLTNPENDFTGGIVLDVGTLSVSDTRAVGATSTLNVVNGTTLELKNPADGGTNPIAVTVENGGTLKPSGALGNVSMNVQNGGHVQLGKDPSGTMIINLEEGASTDLYGTPATGVKITGKGTINVTGAADFSSWSDMDFSGTYNLKSDRTKVSKQDKLGTNDITVNVANGAQLWLIGAGLVTGTFNIAGMGYASNVDGQGAIRMETSSKLAGQVNLLADACIGTYYNAETGNTKDIQAAVDLNDYTLWLGASDNITDETVTSSPYWFTDMTVSGKITGTGGISINNTKTIYLTNTNDFSGKTLVKNGALALNAVNAIAESCEVENLKSITFSQDQTIQNLSGPATATLTGAAGKTLTLFNSKDTEFAGNVTATNIIFGNGNEDADVGTLRLSGDIIGLESLIMNVGISSTGVDKLILSSFDPTQTNLQVTITPSDDFVFGGGNSYEVLALTKGALPTDYDWSLVSMPGNLDDWFFYAEGGSLMAGVNTNKYPEPSTFVLLALSAGLVFWRRKKFA